jgi:hypothetical protein
MNESTLDLFCSHEDETYADELERKAAELEITCDYLLMEFILE